MEKNNAVLGICMNKTCNGNFGNTLASGRAHQQAQETPAVREAQLEKAMIPLLHTGFSWTSRNTATSFFPQ